MRVSLGCCKDLRGLYSVGLLVVLVFVWFLFGEEGVGGFKGLGVLKGLGVRV